MKLNLHIDRLVLEGLPVSRHDSARIQAAVQRELTLLLRESGLAHEYRTSGATPMLDAGRIRIERTSQPAGIGRQIARGVYDGIGRKQ